MIQRFIELGEGYSDLYELIDIAHRNKDRVKRLLSLHTNIAGSKRVSLAVVLSPTTIGDFQPIYICREGITLSETGKSRRYDLFEKLANELEMDITTLDIKNSHVFSEKELFYQYLIGILRLNHIIQPLT